MANGDRLEMADVVALLNAYRAARAHGVVSVTFVAGNPVLIRSEQTVKEPPELRLQLRRLGVRPAD